MKIKIKDNGIGIKSSELDRIFDKGFTGTNGRNQKNLQESDFIYAKGYVMNWEWI